MNKNHSPAGQPSYLTLNAYLKGIFGQRVQKIPLDAGLGCPNRDGTKGIGGCIYCNTKGSGTGAHSRGKDIKKQLEEGKAFARARYNTKKFIAYFQSFSNTYASIEKLEDLYTQVIHEDVVGIAIGTRPDCIDADILNLIKKIGKGLIVWMEYGLQSASDETLKKINRNHTVNDFIEAIEMTKRTGLKTCAHIIFGLPEEEKKDMEKTVDLISSLKIDSVKFHQLYICRGTRLDKLFKSGKYQPITQKEYSEMVAWSIKRLPKETVIQRLAGDPVKEELVEPFWSLDKQGTINMINNLLR